MKVTALTSLILDLNRLIDSRNYDDLSVEETYEAIGNKQVLVFLKQHTDFDPPLPLSSSEQAWIEDMLNEIWGRWTGSEVARQARKWGVENRGLCLILALIAGIIGKRRGLDWYSD